MICQQEVEYLSEGNVSIIDALGAEIKHDTMRGALEEYVSIEETLNKLKVKRQ